MSRISTEELKRTFGVFKGEVDQSLKAVGNHLEAGQYEQAAVLMNTLTERMARTSVAMRAILIKGGHISESV